MQEQSPLNPPEQELEAALIRLQPALPGIDRNMLLYQAGYRAAVHRMRWWMTSTSAMAAILLIAMFVHLPAGVAPIDTTARFDIEHRSASSRPHIPQTFAQDAPRSGWFVLAGQFLSSADDKAESAEQAETYVSVRQAVLEHGASALPAVENGQRPMNRIVLRRMLGLRPEEAGGEVPYRVLTRTLAGDSL